MPTARTATFVLSSDWSQDYLDRSGGGSRPMDVAQALGFAQWDLRPGRLHSAAERLSSPHGRGNPGPAGFQRPRPASGQGFPGGIRIQAYTGTIRLAARFFNPGNVRPGFSSAYPKSIF